MMRGVPADLNLQPFLGATLVQICIGESQLQFNFQSEQWPKGQNPSISVEGYWEVRTADGVLLDHGPKGDRDVVQSITLTIAQATFRAHSLLGGKVVNSSLQPPMSLTLVFEDGQQFEAFDNSERYESLSVHPGDYYI